MKVGIVGSGFVGSTAAYAMVMKGIGREIVMVDRNEKRAKAETSDILHAVPFAHPLTLREGDYSELEGCRLVIISAGVSQKKGESRLDLLKRNAHVFSEVVPSILKYAPETILVVATNPLDIMTFLASHYASYHGVPVTRIMGTGTMLDTARFRSLLGGHVGVDPQHVHGYVIGEHGDSEVLTWSLATVGSLHVENYCHQQGILLDEVVRKRIDTEVRNAAYSIIEGKGATYYGIGSAIAKIADVILHDQRSILTVSTPDPGGTPFRGIAISMPNLVGGEGLLATIPLPLNDEEDFLLKKSAEVVRNAVEELEGLL